MFCFEPLYCSGCSSLVYAEYGLPEWLEIKGGLYSEVECNLEQHDILSN